jgi:transmembrane sensor
MPSKSRPSSYAVAALAVLALAVTPVLAEGRGVQLASARTEASGSIAPEIVESGKGKRIVAVNGPLSEVLAHVSRYFNGEIILADANMGGRTVTGAYDIDNAALSLQTIVSPLGAQVTEVTPWMLIVSSE